VTCGDVASAASAAARSNVVSPSSWTVGLPVSA
jgi:hypothetical protein